MTIYNENLTFHIKDIMSYPGFCIKLVEVDSPDTISEGIEESPIRIILSLLGSVQQRGLRLSYLSSTVGRREILLAMIFSQNRCEDEPPSPPQARPEQLEWRCLEYRMFWIGQELPLDGLNISTLLSELDGSPPLIRNPKIIPNC